MPIIQTIMKGSSFLPKENQEAYKRVVDGDPLLLYREPDNQYDPNAVRVCNLLGAKLAYVAKEDAAAVAMAMDAGFEVTCKCVEHRPKIEIQWSMPNEEEEEEEDIDLERSLGADDELEREKEWSNE